MLENICPQGNYHCELVSGFSVDIPKIRYTGWNRVTFKTYEKIYTLEDSSDILIHI
jgi:hypothetical protein